MPLNRNPSIQVGEIVNLRLSAFFRAIRDEKFVFLSLMLFVLIEYLRPQNMYPALEIIPWGQVALILCLASIFVTGSKAIRFGAMDKIFILISVVVILSIVFAWDSSVSLENWTVFASWIVLYFCVVSILTTPRRMLLFIIFFLLINFKMSQHGARTFALRGFAFTNWGLAGSPGWFQNSGELALQMVVAIAIGACLLLGLKKYIENRTRWWVLPSSFSRNGFSDRRWIVLQRRPDSTPICVGSIGF